MNLIRWEPFSGMDEMFNRFPSLFARFPRYVGSGDANNDWTPPVDISETGEEYLIRAALPAVKKEDVNVTVEDGMLTLAGERHQREELRVDEPNLRPPLAGLGQVFGIWNKNELVGLSPVGRRQT